MDASGVRLVSSGAGELYSSTSVMTNVCVTPRMVCVRMIYKPPGMVYHGRPVQETLMALTTFKTCLSMSLMT